MLAPPTLLPLLFALVAIPLTSGTFIPPDPKALLGRNKPIQGDSDPVTVTNTATSTVTANHTITATSIIYSTSTVNLTTNTTQGAAGDANCGCDTASPGNTVTETKTETVGATSTVTVAAGVAPAPAPAPAPAGSGSSTYKAGPDTPYLQFTAGTPPSNHAEDFAKGDIKFAWTSKPDEWHSDLKVYLDKDGKDPNEAVARAGGFNVQYHVKGNETIQYSKCTLNGALDPKVKSRPFHFYNHPSFLMMSCFLGSGTVAVDGVGLSCTPYPANCAYFDDLPVPERVLL